jgi:hypothetical protein
MSKIVDISYTCIATSTRVLSQWVHLLFLVASGKTTWWLYLNPSNHKWWLKLKLKYKECSNKEEQFLNMPTKTTSKSTNPSKII